MVFQPITGVSSYSRAADAMFGEPYTLVVPRVIDTDKRCVFYAHGAAGTNVDAVSATSKGIPAIMFALAQAGFVVFAADFGGYHTYGNATVLASMEARWAEMKLTGLCATDKFIATGASMGTLSSHSMALENPDEVAGLINWVPLVDPEGTRTRNDLGLRELQNAAWGMPVGSYIGGADQTPLPYAGNPLLFAGDMEEIPTQMFYSTADPISSKMTEYLAARGSSAVGHVVSSVLGHSDAAIQAASVPDAVAFAQSIDR